MVCHKDPLHAYRSQNCLKAYRMEGCKISRGDAAFPKDIWYGDAKYPKNIWYGGAKISGSRISYDTGTSTQVRVPAPYICISLTGQTVPFAAFNSFRINTWREGLGDCLYRFGSRLCNFPVTSWFCDHPHDAYSKPV